MYLDLGREVRKSMEHEVDYDTSSGWWTWNDLQRLVKEPKDLEIRRQVEAIKTTALLRSDIILRKNLETWVYLHSVKLQWETIW